MRNANTSPVHQELPTAAMLTFLTVTRISCRKLLPQSAPSQLLLMPAITLSSSIKVVSSSFRHNHRVSSLGFIELLPHCASEWFVLSHFCFKCVTQIKQVCCCCYRFLCIFCAFALSLLCSLLGTLSVPMWQPFQCSWVYQEVNSAGKVVRLGLTMQLYLTGR